jgi:glutathione synthase/RimK-type ligase-like ATP-grasp enzyme
LKVALVTARPARGLDEDEPLLNLAFQKAGSEVGIAEWDDPKVDWGSFDVALLRSAWDYCERIGEFLAWVERASQVTHVLNPLPLVRWNTDKHYLAHLAASGAAVVPSTFIEPGDNPAAALGRFLELHPQAELVVKPAIGAGSRDTQRHLRSEFDAAVTHARRLLDAGRSVLVQPYLGRVDKDGETALMFFEGQFSHAIRKGPLLPRGGAATTGLFAAETITPREPGKDELRLAEKVVSVVPFGTPLYARVDLIRDDSGAPCVLELEMAEPSLFFVHAAGSAELFAAAVQRWFDAHGRRAG